MNNYWAFAPMRDSSDLVGDPDALRTRYDEDGYLLLRRLIEPKEILRVRGDVTAVLNEAGWLMPGRDPTKAHTELTGIREGDDKYFDAYDRVQRLESFHSLGHDPALVDVMRKVLDESAFPHPLKVLRLILPNHFEVSTPPHQDFANNQGSVTLTAAWTPLGDCPMSLGSLAILRGSHRLGLLPLRYSLGPGNRQAQLPSHQLDDLRWVTTDFSPGDVVIFGSLTVHAALHNADFQAMRLSADFRFQPVSEPLTDLVLEPHFGRLTWEEIYADWESTELQYYWHDLDLDVVEFDFAAHDIGEPTEADYAEALRYQYRMAAAGARTPSPSTGAG